jgi:hypothetical protein
MTRLNDGSSLGTNSSTVLSNFSYQYDVTGEITRWTQVQGGSSVGDYNYGKEKGVSS